MNITHDLIVEFQTYANSLSSGHLKFAKAMGILHSLNRIPELLHDEVRFLAYLRNTLEMEGFGQVDIELVMDWLLGLFVA